MSERKKGGLSAGALKKIKEKLLERKAEFEEGLQDLYRDKNYDEVAQDVADQVQSISMETLKISLQDTEISEYNRILKALKMIDDGTYGICIDCEKPISEKRLHLYPNATRCLSCQELFDDQQLL